MWWFCILYKRETWVMRSGVGVLLRWYWERMLVRAILASIRAMCWPMQL